MMSYTDAENGKVALMQEILGVKDIQISTCSMNCIRSLWMRKRMQEQEIVRDRMNFHDFSKTKKRMLINNVLFFVTATGFKPVTG